MILGDRESILAVERHASGDELVEDDPEAVDVGGRHQLTAQRLFGAHVVGVAWWRLLCEVGPALGLLEPHVDHDDTVVGGLDQSARLDGAVDETLLVKGGQTECGLSSERGRRSWR